MTRPYYGSPRSVKQKWAYNRCFFNKGSLISAQMILRRIARDPSTLLYESLALTSAYDRIDKALNDWSIKERTAASWKQFQKYHKP